METLNIRDARQHLSEIVDAAERGESVVITRRGQKVACVGPVGPAADGGLPDLSKFRAEIQTKGKSLSASLVDARQQERY
jgi:prevent-host-death family protein